MNRNDGITDIETLSNSDMENISESIISGLFEEDILSLKRFCLFFKNLFDKDGNIRQSSSSAPEPTPKVVKLQEKQGDKIDSSIDGTTVFVGDASAQKETTVGSFFANDVSDLFKKSQNNDSSQGIVEFTGDSKTFQLKNYFFQPLFH